MVTCPHHSKGLFPRIANAWNARRNQSGINHVTGDVNFLAIGLNRKKTILTHHDASFLHRTSGIKKAILRLFWLQLPVMRCAYVTTVSDATKQDLLDHIRCDPKKVIVIHNAISRDFKPSPKPELGSPPRLLQIGTAANKNIERLFEAIAGLDCQLTIIGKLTGSQRKSLEEKQTRFTNLIDLTDAEVQEQYRLADIVTFASTIEGFGMPILEAQAIGRPVVTSNCSSMPEVAGDTACIVDPFDSQSIRSGIEKIIGNHVYREKLVKLGHENVQRFDRANISSQYFELYRLVAEEIGTEFTTPVHGENFDDA